MLVHRNLHLAIRAGLLFAGAAALGLPMTGHALADKIKNPTAVFSGLDKITGRIVSFEVAVDETVQFGALQMTPRVCYSRPPTESPKTTAFLEVDEVTLDNKYRRIFTGWMFAASPGLHAIEHPIYDVWLVDCKGGNDIIAEAREQEDVPAMASKPEKTKRQRNSDPTRTAQQVNPNGQVDVEAPRGVPVQPKQKPSRKFFPTNEGPAPAPPPQQPQSIFDAIFR
ncbi:hypothetical protein ASF08_04720 [Methylobacterium sp. Leaf85]|uniref:DUF2155 domain-containing protein n=1 Tax=Methylobacterium bullatum TaxID=570505 RepID=A0A679JNC9_9HYPH|nr:hypothetical protein ASF08_04720 [Methylobacterium sp. Leaf85]MBD8902248.1 hypothetical protein [Methylobacterium bullatum]GJD38947.1 hypothetical protein OICFNHDK_1399 [Methylobacterium bullatum]CAA2140555.1 hypothetical protein MBLL_02185 [Methylobacterium bullatum]